MTLHEKVIKEWVKDKEDLLLKYSDGYCEISHREEIECIIFRLDKVLKYSKDSLEILMLSKDIITVEEYSF